MNLQNLALRKGKEVAGYNVSNKERTGCPAVRGTDSSQIQTWTTQRKSLGGFQDEGIRFFATDRPSKSQLRDERAREHVKDLSSKHQANKVARAIDKVSCTQFTLLALLTRL